jgi:hypothetical protein
MCVVCVSVVTAVSLLSPTQAPTVVEKKNIQQHQLTDKSCSKPNLNKTIKLSNKKVLICTAYGDGYYNTGYKWIVKSNSKPSTKSTQNKFIPVSTTQSEKVTKVYQNILGSYSPSPQYYFKMTVITSPNVNKSRVNEIVSNYEKSVNFFPMPIDKKITWVFLDETEKDWWIQKTSEIDRPNLEWWEGRKCNISQTTICAYGNGNPNSPIFYMVVGSSSKWESNDLFVADHESAHMYQMVTWTHSDLNCWVIEGQATAIGMAMSSRNMDMNDIRQSQIRDIQRMFINYKTFSTEDWINAYAKINSDRNYCFQNGAGYNMGMLAVESMYDLYDGKIVDKFFIDYSKSKNFNDTLLKYFKINESEFYKNVALYIKNSI